MNINPTNQQNFDGKVIIKNKISRAHRSLVDRNRQKLDVQIKDMPFDVVVKESKTKQSLTLSTNVDGADTFVVSRRKHDIVETAGRAISDGMNKSEVYKKMVRATEILNYKKYQMLNVISGNFKEARETHKEIAKLAVKDFDTYKQVTNVRITNVPPDAGKILLVNSLKYRIYYAFSKKTPEEKLMVKMNKEYIKKMKAQKIKIKPVEIPFQTPY